MKIIHFVPYLWKMSNPINLVHDIGPQNGVIGWDSKRAFQRYIISPISMNIEEVMANILNWTQFEPYMRPNNLEESLIYIYHS